MGTRKASLSAQYIGVSTTSLVWLPLWEGALGGSKASLSSSTIVSRIFGSLARLMIDGIFDGATSIVIRPMSWTIFFCYGDERWPIYKPKNVGEVERGGLMNRKRAQGGIWLLLSVASSLGACWLPRGCLWRLKNRKSVQGGIRPGNFCMFACLGAWLPRGCLWGFI